MAIKSLKPILTAILNHFSARLLRRNHNQVSPTKSLESWGSSINRFENEVFSWKLLVAILLKLLKGFLKESNYVTLLRHLYAPDYSYKQDQEATSLCTASSFTCTCSTRVLRGTNTMKFSLHGLRNKKDRYDFLRNLFGSFASVSYNDVASTQQ